MKNIKELLFPSNAPTVKEAVQARGMKVRLPDILDDYLHFVNQGIASDAVITHLSYEVAEKHDIGATDAEDIIYGTLIDLGVEL